MDRENGFNDDAEDITPVIKPKATVTQPSKPENEPTTTEEPVASSDALELELHDHSKMDESDDEEEEELVDDEESMKAATTLVKLVDLGQEQSAQVPRQTKRRSSSDGEDEESYDYEYSIGLNDQQLNYKTSSIVDRHPLDHESDLNIYSEPLVHVKPQQPQPQPDQSSAAATSTRSNHPRKKLKI